MNKPIVVAISALTLFVGAILMIPSIQIANAQYAGDAGLPAASLEEQLALAREKISNAQQQGAYGSGTAMLWTNINQTVLMIVALVVIFGGVAGAFFAASRSGRRKPSYVSHETASGDSAYCSNCGTQVAKTAKFCHNCGTQVQIAR